ncbi:hypothetical protein ACSP9K_005052 [Citrobacter werkmanii]
MRVIVLSNVDSDKSVFIEKDEAGLPRVFQDYEQADSWACDNTHGRWSKLINLDDDDD